MSDGGHMRKSSDNHYKTDFILRVAKTIGFQELAIAIQVTVYELNNKISGLISISDKEIEQIYQLLCNLTAWERSHV